MNILYVKSLHIIFVITWFAGLFYIVRLFVYHAEAEKRPDSEKKILQDQYKVMEKRLWYIIAWPSMIGTYVFGFWLLYKMYGFIIPAWLILKLAFVFGLTLYHLQCGIIFNQLKRGIVKYSSVKMRLWNEVATVFLIVIVFIVELQNTSDWLWGLIGLIIFAALLFTAVLIYRRARIKKEEKTNLPDSH